MRMWELRCVHMSTNNEKTHYEASLWRKITQKLGKCTSFFLWRSVWIFVCKSRFTVWWFFLTCYRSNIMSFKAAYSDIMKICAPWGGNRYGYKRISHFFSQSSSVQVVPSHLLLAQRKRQQGPHTSFLQLAWSTLSSCISKKKEYMNSKHIFYNYRVISF